MKTTRTLIAGVLAAGCAISLVLAAGCADKEPPSPPPGVAVVGFVPDYCFWDGYEYVAWDPYNYYYWGPDHVWLVCDPVRVQRVNVWIRSHPNWRTRTVPVVPDHVEANDHPHPLPASPKRHDRDRDHD